MIRLAWRQLRWPAAATAALLVVLVTLAALTRSDMTRSARDSGLDACLDAGRDCSALVDDFLMKFGGALDVMQLLTLAPLLIGLFWGAPMVAREVEQGTHRLVWTQSIGPRRWFAVKVAVLGGAAILLAAVLIGLSSWWARPFLRLGEEGYSRINPQFYGLHGIVLGAYAVFGFAIGVAASVLIRRTVPAMAAALGGYALAGLLLGQLRADLLPAHVLHYRVGAEHPRRGLGDWMLHPQGLLDPAGQPALPDVIEAACPMGDGFSPKVRANAECLGAHGFQYEYVYQPLSRFWALQGLETGILLALAALLLGTAAWWTTRRIS